MAAYISVPRDLTKIKSKVAFNLTKRQLVCFGTAALIGVPLFFVLRDSGGNTAATLGMMAVMLPAFFLGMYEKNGQPMEKLLSYYVQSRFVRPKIRPYKTNNYYAILMKGGMTHDSVLEKDRYLRPAHEARYHDQPQQVRAGSFGQRQVFLHEPPRAPIL